ncbi:MAG: MtrB/PioB family decaheme-associated outer membrane protein [Acidobacteria bacterium]|nr:MtrB/PioB family decaheme-associated outer membrane protein [Acidobacteriota bacterium]
MRKLFVPALLVAMALPVLADEGDDNVQTDVSVATAVGTVSVDKDSSKAEEYGEVPEGFYIKKFGVGFDWKDSGRHMNLWGKNVRLNNAQYGFAYEQEGKYKLTIDYGKVPHLFSKDAVSIWTETAPGVWRIPDSIQTAIQGLNDVPNTDPTYQAGLLKQRLFVANMIKDADQVSLSLMRDRGKVGFTYSMNTAWKYGFEYFQEKRDGRRPFGTAFGFSWATELPEEIDYTTQRLHAGLEYSKSGTTFAAAYDVSLFRNGLDSMTWDNPLRITDRTYSAAYSNGDGTSQGRVALPPDNNGHTLSFAAAKNIGQSRLTGSFAYTLWTDDVKLLPFTINTAITADLPQSSWKGKMQNLSANLGYTAHFGNGNFTARYRLYDRKNKGDHFESEHYVRFDQVLEDVPIEFEPWAYKNQNFDLDFGYNLGASLNWHAVYSFNSMDREHRDVKKANTHSFKTSIDSRGLDWATFRLSYQYSQRRFDEYDLEGTYAVVQLLRYDEANLNQNLLKANVELAPGDKTTIGLTIGYGKDEYPDSKFGLQEGKTFDVGVDLSYDIAERSSLGLYFDHNQLNAFQRSRQSGSTPSTDPNADWTADMTDTIDTVGFNFNTDLKKDRVGWNIDLSYAQADGDGDLFSPPGGTPDIARSLPNVDETKLISAKTGLNFKLFKGAKMGVGYWFQKYEIDDYIENELRADYVTPVPGPNPPFALTSPGMIALNAAMPDYTYHVAWVSLSYLW